MEDYKKFINNKSKKVEKLNSSLRTNNISEIEDSIHLFSNLILQSASELTISVIEMREGGSRSGTNWIQSCIITRYLFEILANHSILKYGNLNEEMESRWKSYLYLRKLQIYGDDTYGIAVELLPEKTKKKLKKKGVQTYLGYNHGDEKIEKNLIVSVKLENEQFQFDDPWGLTMYEKLQYINTLNPDIFLSRWRMYSQISHASSFSLWPTWIDPVPHFDAIQCLTMILNTEYKFHGLDFNCKKFQETIYQLMETAAPNNA